MKRTELKKLIEEVIKESHHGASTEMFDKHGYMLGDTIKSISQLRKGTEYAIVDYGMNQWMVTLEFKGIKNGEYYFKSALQFDDFDISYPKEELEDMIKDGDVVECEE